MQPVFAQILADSGKTLGESFASVMTSYNAYSSYADLYTTTQTLTAIAQSDGKEELAKACRAALSNPDKYTRAAAVIYLSQIGDPAMVQPAVSQLYKESTPDDVYLISFLGYPLTGTAATADGVFGTPPPNAGLLEQIEADLKSDDPQARLKAAHFLSYVPDEQTLPLFRAALKNPDPEVRRYVTASLPRCYVGENPQAFIEENLEAALHDENVGVRRVAAAALAQTGEMSAPSKLLAALKDPDLETRRALSQALLTTVRYYPKEDAQLGKDVKAALKAEKDPLVRCNLANAYAYTLPAAEGSYKQLTPNGHWAFFSGTWKEKEMDSYYQELAGGG
jgi:HEAT repeat protein